MNLIRTPTVRTNIEERERELERLRDLDLLYAQVQERPEVRAWKEEAFLKASKGRLRSMPNLVGYMDGLDDSGPRKDAYPTSMFPRERSERNREALNPRKADRILRGKKTSSDGKEIRNALHKLEKAFRNPLDIRTTRVGNKRFQTLGGLDTSTTTAQDVQAVSAFSDSKRITRNSLER